MVRGLIGLHGQNVLYRVKMGHNLEHARAPIRHRCMVEKIVLELIMKANFAQKDLHVSLMGVGQNGVVGLVVMPRVEWGLISATGPALIRFHKITASHAKEDLQILLPVMKLNVQWMVIGQIGKPGVAVLLHARMVSTREHEHVQIPYQKAVVNNVLETSQNQETVMKVNVLLMENGQNGLCGQLVQQHVALVTNLETDRVTIPLHNMVGSIVQAITMTIQHVQLPTVQLTDNGDHGMNGAIVLLHVVAASN